MLARAVRGAIKPAGFMAGVAGADGRVALLLLEPAGAWWLTAEITPKVSRAESAAMASEVHNRESRRKDSRRKAKAIRLRWISARVPADFGIRMRTF